METVEILFANPVFALFVVIGGGLLLGQISYKGVSLGTSAVLFTALAAGHFGVQMPPVIGTVGLVLFVYCVGVGAGGRFFRAVAREGSMLAQVALVVTGSAALLTLLAAKLLDLPADLATGIFAGSLTSTPALAAADEALRAGAGGSSLVIGYSIAYPFGVVGVVLFVQLLPRLLKWLLDQDDQAVLTGPAEISRKVVEVTNHSLIGQPLAGSKLIERYGCQVSRVLRDGRLAPLASGDIFEPGSVVLLVGTEEDLESLVELVGKPVSGDFAHDTDRELRRLLVTSREVAGRRLSDIDPVGNHGVIVTRVARLGMAFVPGPETIIERHDVLTAVGYEDNLKKFSDFVGHRETQVDATDLLSLSIGIAAGVLVGMVPFALPGSEAITLGMAGGPLIVGLLLGHFGRVGGIVGHIPRPTRLLLQEMGLVLFLADAGIQGGSGLVATVTDYGVSVFLMGLLVTLVPMLVALLYCRYVGKLSPLRTLGGICGGMTSTPALGAITARTDAQAPIISYATAYPVALVIMTLLAKILVGVLG